MRHSPVAAARVVAAPSVAAARQAVAREYERVLQPLVALPRRGHRHIDAPDCLLRGASPQREASLPWLAKSAMSMDMASSEAVRGPMPGTVSRHLYVSSAESSADISEVSDSISAAFSDILRASSRTARSSQATAAGRGLLDDLAIRPAQPPWRARSRA